MGASGFMTAKIVLYGLLAPPPPARQVTRSSRPAGALLRAAPQRAGGGDGVRPGATLRPFEDALPSYAYDFGRAIFVTVLVVNLGWLTWLVGLVPRFQQTGRMLRLVLLAGLGVIVAAEWLGYRNLSGYLLRGPLESSVIGAGLWLANAVTNEVCTGLDGASTGWAARLRRGIGLAAGESFPGLLWLRLLVVALLAVGAGLLLLHVWGLSSAGTALVFGYLVDGVAVGDMRFVPAKVPTGVVLFAALLGATRWIKNRAETKWLAHSQMDRGAKDTAVAMLGYGGFVLATLTGLSAAGVGLANLAIIASALSVGIGFGLQNIVSSFVSGLILLFERPIKTGDRWSSAAPRATSSAFACAPPRSAPSSNRTSRCRIGSDHRACEELDAARPSRPGGGADRAGAWLRHRAGPPLAARDRPRASRHHRRQPTRSRQGAVPQLRRAPP